MPVALALSTTAAVRSAVLAGAGPAVLSELTVTDDITARPGPDPGPGRGPAPGAPRHLGRRAPPPGGGGA